MLFVSLIGDSISTYDGFNPEGYEVYYDKPRQMNNGMSSVYDTWWAKVNQGLHAYLCVNNSFSGSRVTGEGFPAASSTERTSLLHTRRYSPDLILIYIGFNDFGNGVPIRDPERSRFFRKNPAFFEDAYEIMLKKVKHGYPNARIICATLMRTEVRGRECWDFPEHYRGNAFEDYNNAIRRCCKKENCFLADLSALGMRYETQDGTHPTAKGHLAIANAWLTCLRELGAAT